MSRATTHFGKCFIEANEQLAIAVEHTGDEMSRAIERAEQLAQLAADNSFRGSPAENLMASELTALVAAVRQSLRG